MWKHVLSETQLLRRRHLSKFDLRLSHTSLDAMIDHDVLAVMPEGLAAPYHGHEILTVEAFIEHAEWVMGRRSP